MPGSLPCILAYSELCIPGRLTVTLGCKIPYPFVTLFLISSYQGRFKGCAIAPINFQAEPIGNWVSASRVITYFIAGKTDWSPTTSAKLSFALPRNNRFNSESFPRFLSYPIHAFSCWFQRRGR